MVSHSFCKQVKLVTPNSAFEKLFFLKKKKKKKEEDILVFTCIRYKSSTSCILSAVGEILLAPQGAQKLDVSHSCHLPRTQLPNYISSKYVYREIFSCSKSDIEV